MLFSIALGLFALVISYGKNRRVVSVVASVLIVLLFLTSWYINMPSLSEVFFKSLFISILIGWIISQYNKGHYFSIRNIFSMRLMPLALVSALWTFSFVKDAEMFNSERYAKQLHVVEVLDSVFMLRTSYIPVNRMINVSADYAKEIVKNRLALVPSMASGLKLGEPSLINLDGQFDIKKLNEQNVNLSFDNQQVWFIPLEYSGFWSFVFTQSIPAYAIASANNPNEYWVVKDVNGQSLNMHYLFSAYFNKNIKRHIRLSEYSGYEILSLNMELDNKGRPFYVVAISDRSIANSLGDVTGVLIVDAQSGQISKHTLYDVPKWVDVIYPKEVIEKQITYWGKYTASNDVVSSASSVLVPIYFGDQCYWYTGITKNIESTFIDGFLVVSARTKNAIFYKGKAFNDALVSASMPQRAVYELEKNFLIQKQKSEEKKIEFTPIIKNNFRVLKIKTIVYKEGSAYLTFELLNDEVFVVKQNIKDLKKGDLVKVSFIRDYETGAQIIKKIINLSLEKK